ncbi:putative transcription elongation factor SPT6-like isoform X2 [Penaeus vannamei]|uniref:Putative transcription elongation factor SPT6-like isoform X2 n=1 Tax=Penaeus vannamei TaxID=6689 RepID=A0A3R7QA02_PENVA|nr:putative transcription elongation factor SPT6-like isoform X2 [Penaeus vannamei]
MCISRKLKKLKKSVEDSSEEEDEDEEMMQEENKGFINDDDDEEEDEGGSDSEVEGKRKRDDDDDDDLDADNLDEDDLDLIEENIGVKLDRKKKFKRLKRIEDEDSDAEDEDVQGQIRREIFEGSGDEDDEEAPPAPQVPQQPETYASEEEEEESDGEGSFIVDDDGKPIAKTKKKAIFEDEGLEAARDIFGCDFDYGEFEQYEERRHRRKERRKPIKKSIYEVFEPSELERGHLTDQDHEIRKSDIPERFQLRQIPVTRTRGEGDDRATDKELDQEAKWIYHHAFFKPYISNQEGRDEAKLRSRRDMNMIQKIYNALDLMRNSTCEVPFIAFYRKEEVQPELNIHDLWKVYRWDEKWCQLKRRKENLRSRFQMMSEFQGDLIMRDLDAPLPENVRMLKEEDIERIDELETSEQFNDCYKQFLLYYGKDLPEMHEHMKAKNKERQNTVRTTKIVKVLRKVKRKKKKKKKEPQQATEDTDALKKAVRRHEYELLRKAGIEALTKKFGLTPEQFGENLRDNYQRFDCEQCQEDPLKEAEEHISKMCSTPERVLEAAVRMVGWQLACEPLVRRTVREAYFERARISARPTPQGLKIVDEHHPLYPIKYLKDKPVTDLQGDQFLRLKCGVEDKLMTISLSDTIEGNTSLSYLDEMKQLYYRDEFSQVVQDWNDLRGRAVTFAFKRIIEDLKRELSQRLLQESKDHVIEQCCSKLYNWIKIAPYNPGDFSDEDEDDWDTSKGFRVFSIAYVPDLSQAAFGCCIDIDGDCCEYIRLPHLLKRRNAYNERDALAKENDIRRMQEFIIRRKPHVVAVSGESREGFMVKEDLIQILKDLEEQEQFPKINVEIIDNDLAHIYAMSKKGEADFLDYPPLLRQAISIGRRIQDPLIEFSQLCNADDELLNIKFHSLQDQINNAELLDSLYTEFVNRTNEVGVDLNRAVAYPYTQNLVQFVCGLGPRKANLLIKNMKQNNQRLENRNQLVVNFHMGPKVFINCAGFIKIDTNALGDSDNYIEVLDSTRIHPEAYDWARKMAVDALEYEDEEGKPAEALEEILETPERLSELDLEAFATELQNQGFGKKNTTLYDIRHELNHRYKDFRMPFRSPTPEEIFNILTKESPETFYVGKLVQVTVTNFIHRKPRGDQLDNANPVRNEDTGLWQCPFCLKNDFPELSEVWNHFDAGDCPGQAIGIRVRLDNGISGFISIKNLSDKTVTNPAERVKRNGIVLCRIMKIDPEKFSVELTSRTSDLQDRDGKWKAPKDAYYDYETEEKDMNTSRKKMDKKKTQYQKRVIAHPSFRNIDYNEAEKVMQHLEQGEVIIRPSSKGVDHLTATWKVTEGICQHIDIREQDKQNDFSLGQKLWIMNEEFEDLDEIIARYISPMAINVRQILEYKYYKESVMGDKNKASEILKEEKKKNPKTIPYLFSPRKDLPGKFMLSYLPRVKVIHEFVTVTPEGFKFRGRMQHPNLASLLKWFKVNFRRPAPSMGATPGMMSTRTPYMGGTTPNLMGVDASTIQKVAQNLNPHMLHNLSQAATNTPYGAHTPGAFSQGYSNYANTPYTPSGQTPFMTPYATPGPSTTPRYSGSQTPSYSSVGNRTPSHRPSTGHSSQPSRSTPSASSRSEQMDWKMAAAAWVQAKGGGGGGGARDAGRATPRHHDGGRSTPRYSEPRDSRYASSSGYPDDGSRRTPRYDDRTPRPYHDYDNPRATPRSARSTPKTIHSPTNMSIGGDQTPLYDE